MRSRLTTVVSACSPRRCRERLAVLRRRSRQDDLLIIETVFERKILTDAITSPEYLWHIGPVRLLSDQIQPWQIDRE
jgi:hypothetical protein